MSIAESSRRRVHRTSNYASEEYIGNMQDSVITNILNRLPLKEAVGTSTLARIWRFKWSLLTDVILNEDFFYFLTNKFDGKDITRLLLHLRGPIRRFAFSIEPKTVCGLVGLNYEEIGDWLLFLSREGIEQLTIRNWYGEQITLPTQIYSCKELKHLEQGKTKFTGMVNKLLAEGNSNKNVSVDLTLNISGMDFGNNVMVSFIIEMIRGSPNLQMLETRASIELSDVPLELSALNLDSNTMGPRQLQSVVFQSFPRSENELTIIKFILACSPFLKKIYIRVSNLSDDESENININWKLPRKLLKLHRASSTSGVDFF